MEKVHITRAIGTDHLEILCLYSHNSFITFILRHQRRVWYTRQYSFIPFREFLALCHGYCIEINELEEVRDMISWIYFFLHQILNLAQSCYYDLSYYQRCLMFINLIHIKMLILKHFNNVYVILLIHSCQ